MDANRFGPVIGEFQLMDRGAGTDFSGVKHALLPSVRVVEDGEVRTVIEAVLAYNDSNLVLDRTSCRSREPRSKSMCGYSGTRKISC